MPARSSAIVVSWPRLQRIVVSDDQILKVLDLSFRPAGEHHARSPFEPARPDSSYDARVEFAAIRHISNPLPFPIADNPTYVWCRDHLLVVYGPDGHGVLTPCCRGKFLVRRVFPSSAFGLIYKVVLARVQNGRTHVDRTGPLSDLEAIFEELETGKFLGRAVITDLAR